MELLLDAEGQTVTGALLYNMRHADFIVVEAAATLVATGGGPTQYRFHAPGPEKSADGIAMLYRAGVRMRDMEMIQFHPTGLIVPGSVVAGSLLEEGLRGAGAHLYNGDGERYMLKYAPDVAERATRDVVSRSAYLEMMAGRACPEGGVRIDAAHLGADFVLRNFPGMAERCAQFKYDLAHNMVPVSPSAHFFMGGAAIDVKCRASLDKLFVAGEDAGGVHGANRLGGNGICESRVYGRLAGKSIADYLSKAKPLRQGKRPRHGRRDHRPPDRTLQPQERQVALRKPARDSGNQLGQRGVVRRQDRLETALTDLLLRHDVEKASVSGNKV
ncbi:MAG: FAD-binding protein [Bilophila wadsworthia]